MRWTSPPSVQEGPAEPERKEAEILAQTERGCLGIADITGYTAYLNREAWPQMREMYAGLMQETFSRLATLIAEDGAGS